MLNTPIPSRRNASVKAPWLHDGTAATLPEVMRMTARYQTLAPIVRFLSSIAGEAAHETQGFGPASTRSSPQDSDAPLAIMHSR
jgi:hypothetical protein